MVLQEPEKIVERARARMKAKIGKSVEILKANSHELLQGSKQLAMPAQEDIANAMTPGSVHQILDRIHALRKIHRSDFELWKRLDDLELSAIRRGYDLEEQPVVPHE